MGDKISRRRFLALAGGAAGAMLLGCGGAVVVGTRQLPVDLVRTNCGEDVDKVLVAYATRCGSTGAVAEAIGEALCAAGVPADVRPVKEVSDVSGYRAAVVGSAIRIGKWLPEATKWVKTHQVALRGKPLAYFGVCMALAEDTEETRREAESFLQPVRDLVQPVEEAMFAGVVDYEIQLDTVDSFDSADLITDTVAGTEYTATLSMGSWYWRVRALPGGEVTSPWLVTAAEPLVQVTTHTNTDYAPSLLQADDGTLWAVWYSYRSGNPDLWYKTSSDAGATWSAAAQLTTEHGGDFAQRQPAHDDRSSNDAATAASSNGTTRSARICTVSCPLPASSTASPAADIDNAAAIAARRS